MADQKAKKVYVKPDLNKIALKPEEAVLGACKITSSFGPGATGCTSVVSCVTTTGS